MSRPTYEVTTVVHLLLQILVMVDAVRVARPPDVGPHHHEAVTGQPGMSSVVSLCRPVRLPVGQILQHGRKLDGSLHISGRFYQSDALLNNTKYSNELASTSYLSYVKIPLGSPQPQSEPFTCGETVESVRDVHHAVGTEAQLVQLLPGEVGQDFPSAGHAFHPFM